MTQKKQELLEVIEQREAMSIYRLAILTGRNYRSVYKHVQQLAAAGCIGIRRETRDGRRVSIVESVYQQRLNRLNDMYALYVSSGASLRS